MDKFWRFKALANETAELFLYGEISDVSWYGDEVTPAQFQRDLAALGDVRNLNVYINSPGGDVFAGITIYNILKRHPAYVTVHVDGMAASSAAIVAMAGDTVIIPRCGTIMLHNAWTRVSGNKSDLYAMADELKRIDGQLAGIYAAKSGKDAEYFAGLMDGNSWMSGEEALAAGLCDEVDDTQVAACVDAAVLARYKNVPGKIADNGAETQPMADSNIALENQRKHFDRLRRKLLEG